MIWVTTLVVSQASGKFMHCTFVISNTGASPPRQIVKQVEFDVKHVAAVVLNTEGFMFEAKSGLKTPIIISKLHFIFSIRSKSAIRRVPLQFPTLIFSSVIKSTCNQNVDAHIVHTACRLIDLLWQLFCYSGFNNDN
jgi:hypothetical protein